MQSQQCSIFWKQLAFLQIMASISCYPQSDDFTSRHAESDECDELSQGNHTFQCSSLSTILSSAQLPGNGLGASAAKCSCMCSLQSQAPLPLHSLCLPPWPPLWRSHACSSAMLQEGPFFSARHGYLLFQPAWGLSQAHEDSESHPD